MKKLFLMIIGFGFSANGQVFHSDVDNVVQRDARDRYSMVPVTLDLLKEDAYETKSFKVVLKKGESAFRRKLDEASEADLRLKAANVLFHAEKARQFFLTILNSEEVKNMEQVILRLEITNGYDRRGHFTNDAYDPQFNNAVSINGKIATPVATVSPWQREIWFRPKQEIPIQQILNQLPIDPNREVIREARKSILPLEIDNGVRDLSYALASTPFSTSDVWSSLVRQGGTFLVLDGVLQAIRVLNQWSIPKEYYIDTAMIPEIIHHEYSHIALSDYLKPDTSTPVIEGMADYFAAAIGNNPMLAEKIKRYSTAVRKNGKKEQRFQIDFEATDKANADFVLSLLWGLREPFGEEMTNRIVFEARKYLSTDKSDIRNGLTHALLQACDVVCPAGFASPLKLHQYFQDHGL